MELSSISHGNKQSTNITVPTGTQMITSEGATIQKQNQQSSNTKPSNVKQLTDEDFKKLLDNIPKRYGNNKLNSKIVPTKVNHMFDNLG